MTADRFKYSNYSGTEGQRHNGTKQNKVSTQAQRGKCTEAHRFLPDLQIAEGTSNIEHPSASQARALRAGRTLVASGAAEGG